MNEVITMRDAGNPGVTVHLRSGTKAEAERNREELRRAAEWVCGEANGYLIKATIDWNGAQMPESGETPANAVREGGITK